MSSKGKLLVLISLAIPVVVSSLTPDTRNSNAVSKNNVF